MTNKRIQTCISCILSATLLGALLAWILYESNAFCVDNARDPPSCTNLYITWDKFEVDRWVAAWLIKRFVDPSAEFQAIPVGTTISKRAGIPFDIPGGKWRRGPNRCTSELVLGDLGKEDRSLRRILGLVRKLEMAYWRLSPHESEARRLHDELLRIYDSKKTSKERIKAMFVYLDKIYLCDGGNP